MIHRHSTRCCLFLLSGALLLPLVSEPSLAQERRERQRQREQDHPVLSADEMRIFLTREVEDTEARQNIMREALGKLEDGESPEDIRRFMRESTAGHDLRVNRPVTNDEALAALSELNPWMHTRLERLRGENPERFRRQLQRLMPRLRPMVELRHRDPERWELRVQMFKVEQQSRRLAEAVSDAAEDADRQQVTTELRRAVEQLFTIRESMHELEIQRVEDQISQQRQELDESRATRDQRVQDHMQNLIERAAQKEHNADQRPRGRSRRSQPDL